MQGAHMEPSEPNLTEAQSCIAKWWQGARLQERGQHLADVILNEQQLRVEPWSIQCNTELSTKKLGLWKKEAGLRTDQRLSQRLQSINLNTGAFQYLLGERSEALAQRMPTAKPSWQTELETLYFNPANQVRDETNTILLPTDEEQLSYFDLLELTRPLLTHSRRQLATAIHEITGWNHEECQRLAGEASRSLALQFLRMSLRTLLLELKQRRINDKLSGHDASTRYRCFIGQLCRPEPALDLLSNYPVLARQLLNRIRQWQLINTEFFSRLLQDTPLLQNTFNRGQVLGALLQIDAGRGDRHQDGRSVFVLGFSCGLKLVYKPKPLTIDCKFQEFLQWLNEIGVEPKLPQMNIVDRIEYGWCEFITHKECQNQEQVKRFYQRQGAYLAVLGMLEATDFHYENIIAHGEMPYLIDLETLFQPHLADSTAVGPGSRITLPTVMRNGMLPNFQINSSDSPQVDLSGLGNSHDRPTQAAILRDIGLDTLHQEVISSSLPSGMNQPLFDGRPALVTDFAEEVLSGYSKTYRLLLSHKEQLLSETGPLSQFSGLRIRFIIRGTEIYVRLLHALYHPDYLRDGLLQDRLFDKLWLDYDYYPAVRRLIQSEHNALARSDIPLFTTTTTSHAIVSDTGHVFNDFFPLTGMEQSLLRLKRMNNSDLARQYRMIRDNLTCLARRDWSIPIEVNAPLEQITTADLINSRP